MQLLVDGIIQAEPLHKKMHHADSTRRDGVCFFCNLVMNVAGGNHGAFIAKPCLVQSLLDPSLAFLKLTSYLGIHSKTLRVLRSLSVHNSTNVGKRRVFSSFFCAWKENSIKLRLIKV